MAIEVKVVNGVPVPTQVQGTEEAAASETGQLDPKIWEDLDEALESLQEAMPGYLEAEKYYEGTVGEKFINKAVQALLTGSKTDFNVNLAGRVVDAVQDRMEIAAVTAEPVSDDSLEEIVEEPAVDELGAEQPPEMTEEEKVLDEAVSKIWRDNEMDIEAPEVHQKMLAYGDAYLFVGLSENKDEGERVDLFYNSPMSVRVLYQDENPRKKRVAIKRWEVGSKNNRRLRLNLYYDEGTYKFISEGSSDKGGSANYRIFTDDSTDENGFVPNDEEHKEIPFFHFRTARPYGRPEHKKAYGAQDALTKFITNMMNTSDFAAFPQRWALQETGTTTDDDIDWNNGDSDTADETNPSDLQSQLVSGPGRIWPLRNMKAVGQFETADVEQFLKPINTFTGLMAAVTATPVSYFLVTIGSTATPSSGESQRKGESPFISKVNARQLSAEASWQDAIGYGLRLIGMEAEVKVRWAPSQIVSGVDGWRAVQEQQKAGVPVRQTLLEAGYTEAEVTSWGYTEANPDGPGIDLNALATVPLPGNTFPGTSEAQAQNEAQAQRARSLVNQPVGSPLPEAAPVPPAGV